MWTFRKSLVAAAVLLTLFLILRSSHHSTSTVPNIQIATSDVKSASPPLGGEKVDKPPVAVPADVVPERPAHDQQVIERISQWPLTDQLKYLFPYDLQGKFPAYIWQTWKYTPADGKFSESLRPFEASWSEKHPGFVHEVMNDEQADHLIKYLYAGIPDVYEAYASLPVPVLQADFFRYLILLARGGIYTDIDTSALKSSLEWLPDDFKRDSAGLVVGIEVDAMDRPDWSKWYSRRVQFCQWTMLAKPGHPVLIDVVSKITQEALRMKQEGILKDGKMDLTVMEFTGPAVWTDGIMNYFNNPNYFDLKGRNITAMDFSKITEHKQVGDVVILPITSFSPGVGTMGAKEQTDPMAFVKHEFEGSWKPDDERKIGH